MDEKMKNKMDDMDMEMELDDKEMELVAGGFARFRPVKTKSNANSMAANVDETQMKLPKMELPIAGGHKINV